MDLLRLSIQRDTLLAKTRLAGNALRAEVAAHWSLDTILAALPDRNPTDNVRVALTHKARAWARFYQDGQECRAIVDSTTGSKGVDLRIHVRRKGPDHVSYSDEIGSIRGGSGAPITATITATGAHLYPDLVADLCDVDTLQAFGAQHYFDTDLRRLAQELLDQAVMTLWKGIALVLNPTAHAAIRALQSLVAGGSAGEVTCRLLGLDNTPANREALAQELAERLVSEGEDISKLLEITDPNVKRCQRLYDALLERVKVAEGLLGVEIPCWETLAQVENQLEGAAADAGISA